MRDLDPAETDFIASLKRSPNDFDCLTFGLQVEYFIRYIVERGDHSFAVADIRKLFEVADMKSPRSGKPIRPSAGKVDKAMQMLVRQGAFKLRRQGDMFEIA